MQLYLPIGILMAKSRQRAGHVGHDQRLRVKRSNPNLYDYFRKRSGQSRLILGTTSPGLDGLLSCFLSMVSTSVLSTQSPFAFKSLQRVSINTFHSPELQDDNNCRTSAQIMQCRLVAILAYVRMVRRPPQHSRAVWITICSQSDAQTASAASNSPGPHDRQH